MFRNSRMMYLPEVRYPSFTLSTLPAFWLQTLRRKQTIRAQQAMAYQAVMKERERAAAERLAKKDALDREIERERKVCRCPVFTSVT
jgi:hypothetical protein